MTNAEILEAMLNTNTAAHPVPSFEDAAALIQRAEENLAMRPDPVSAKQPARAAMAPETVGRFALAGNATFTVVSKATGNRFTFRVRAPKVDRDGAPVSKEAASVLFVSVLNGPDNTGSYAYIGTVFRRDNTFKYSSKSRISADAKSVKGFAWLFEHVFKGEGKGANKVEIYHSGNCGRCGRLLTTPESVTLGLGPECAAKC